MNHAPPVPKLLTPPDGATNIEPHTELCWKQVEDVDGDDVRYRVFVDDIELEQGKGKEPGHLGPCLGPLDFNPSQTFEWSVQAFEPNDPNVTSKKATPFVFTTLTEDGAQVVFQDDFETDKGWEVEGDARSGKWKRGNPKPAKKGGQTSQPNDCAGGTRCFFTGQNPESLATQYDVSGGSTVLLSPEFDLSGFATASVKFSRFFYKEILEQTGTLLRVELLVPDAGEASGYASTVLEQLESAIEVVGSNVWMPVEYAACGAKMKAGTRLRVTATDLGYVTGQEGVTEAALDSVEIAGFEKATLCDGGLGAICDPQNSSSCSGELLCCPQGTVNAGVYRCAEAVPGLDYDNPAGRGEWNGPLGCDAPDLRVLDPKDSIYFDDIYVGATMGESNYCVLLEGCVDGPGWRKVLRFDTSTPNQGSRDLVMGVPANHPDLFHFSECHGHYHFDSYAEYDLLDGEGTVVAEGHKQAFCLMDTAVWAPGHGPGEYWCGNQGISAGYQDDYVATLDCQWIDVTDVPPGNYELRINLNRPSGSNGLPLLVERDYSNNVIQASVTIQ